MEVRFREFYEETSNLRLGIAELSAAIERTDCDSAARCLLEDELSDIQDKYDQIMNLEIGFSNIDVGLLIKKIQECIECIDFDMSVAL